MESNRFIKYVFAAVITLAVAVLAVTMIVQGAPTTQDVSGITVNQVTFHASGTGSDGWFEWGAYSGGYHWTTLNQTYSGSFEETQLGVPMLTSSTYYVRACDETGCGNEVEWTVPHSNLPNKTAYGAGFIQILRTGFNTSYLLPAMVSPYTETIPGGAPVTWGLLFFFIFAGYWLRPRDIFIPCILAMIAGGSIWLGNSALGVPPEFASIGQGLMYAAIAGIAVSWFSK
jgi:hypothetical protein